jgi:hypothetical protein
MRLKGSEGACYRSNDMKIIYKIPIEKDLMTYFRLFSVGLICLILDVNRGVKKYQVARQKCTS